MSALLPDPYLRFFPRRLVPFAMEAGWEVHPESRTGAWAVLMTRPANALVAPMEVVIQPASRRLVAYAGAE